MCPLPWSHCQNLVRTAPFLTYITVSWCFIAVVISISLAVSYHWTPIAMGTLLQSNLTMLYRVWRSASFLWYCKSSFYLSMQHLSSSGSRFYIECSPLSLQGLWLLAFEGLWSLPFLLSPVPVFPLCPWLVKCSYQVFTNLKSKSNRIPSIKTSLSVSRSCRVALLTHPLFQQPMPVFILLFTKFFGQCLETYLSLLMTMWSHLCPHFWVILNANHVFNKRDWMCEWRIHTFLCELT